MKNIQNNNGKNKQTKKQKVQTHGQGLGRGLAGDMGLNFFFWFFLFFHGFLQFGQNLENTKKKVQTHGQSLGYPHTNQKTKKTKNHETKKTKKQKNKKPRNQKTKKTKNQKNKKNKKTRLHTPRGGGQMQSVGSCLFIFFVFLVFCFFCFFVFLFFCFFGLCVDSHCRCAKQRLPGTVSGCTRSKVDTLQYSTVCYDIVHSANEQQRGMEFNFVRLRHMLLDLCTGNAAICALPQWPVLKKKAWFQTNQSVIFKQSFTKPGLSSHVMWIVGKRLIFGTYPRKKQKLNPRNRKKVNTHIYNWEQGPVHFHRHQLF